MKTILTHIFIFVFFLNSYAQNTGNWQILNEGSRLRNMDFINENIGWIGGYYTLLKTIDAGKNWNFITSQYDIKQFDFIDEIVGYAIAYDDSGKVILKSEDGGFSWFTQKVFRDSFLSNFSVVDKNCVYAIGYIEKFDRRQGLIWKTSDGGITWNVISSDLTAKTLGSPSFFNPDVGVLTCYDHNTDRRYLLRTIDGGHNWDEVVIPESLIFSDLMFINNSSGYFKAETWNENQWEYFFCATEDTFKTWKIKTQQNRYIGPYFVDGDGIIYAYMSDSISSDLMISTSGGDTWTRRYSFQPSRRPGVQDFYFSNQNIAYALYSDGTPFRYNSYIFKSFDDGFSWRISNLSYPFYDVSFFNNNRGIAAGGYNCTTGHCSSYGDIFTTRDGGKTWIDITQKTGPVRALVNVNDQTGFALLAGGSIFKTQNQGAGWNLVFEPEDSTTFYGLYDLFFANQKMGWTCGWYNNPDEEGWVPGLIIFETTDYGEHWDDVWTLPGDEDNWISLYSIHGNDTIAWAVGEQGLMVKYTPQKQWQRQTSITDLPLTDVFFSDKNHGWITGGYLDGQNSQFILLKSSDGGQNWNEINFDKYLINDMYFADSLHGWAVGNDTTETRQWPLGHGMILLTTDGGESWIPVVEGLSSPLNAIHFKDGTGWAVGDNGLILRTDNGITWVNTNTGVQYPAQYELKQNYPNPFNAITNYEYRVSNFAHVNLSIYNLLGQKVATLLDKKQPAGNYQVQWDASAFASGIYIYQLTANPSERNGRTGGQQQSTVLSKKCVVLK